MIKGKHIKEIRDKLQLSQAQAASQINVSTQRLGQIEQQPEREVPQSFQAWHRQKIYEYAQRG